jgi:cytochrome d ubiquinol oxidase subunit II
MLRSIGPVWDGNEVWLIAGGGTLYFAFPLLYASAFRGFFGADDRSLAAHCSRAGH